jgi:hypothetical protein
MSKPNRIHNHAVAAAAIGLVLASNAGAVDLRDWGRKYNNASERFVVLASFNNQAVLDKETQLVWRIAPQPAYTWAYAVLYCYGSHAGGRAGWRLPSFSELRSLLGNDGKLPAGHPFQITVAELYWSSTNHPNTTTGAWAANLLNGGVISQVKDVSYPALCVRGVGTPDQ